MSDTYITIKPFRIRLRIFFCCRCFSWVRS